MFGLTLDQFVGLIKIGVASYQVIKAAVVAGKMAIHDEGGAPIPADELDAKFTAVLAHSYGVGDAAAARIEARA